MQDRTGLTVFLVRVVFVLFETRRFCKVARFVFPDLQRGIVSPYFSIELYQAIGDAAFWDVARMRYRPGVEIDITDRWSLDVFYCYQYEPDKKKHIAGVECSFTF